MIDAPVPDPRAPIARFSAGEISRVELGRLLGKPISFGETLMLLHAHELRLPRYSRPYNPAGIALLRQFVEQHRNG